MEALSISKYGSHDVASLKMTGGSLGPRGEGRSFEFNLKGADRERDRSEPSYRLTSGVGQTREHFAFTVGCAVNNRPYDYMGQLESNKSRC